MITMESGGPVSICQSTEPVGFWLSIFNSSTFVLPIAPFGFFVELRDFLVDGLVHVSTLGDDYYSCSEENRSIVGEHTKKVFRLGDPVRVRLEEVNRERRQLNFVLDHESERKKRPGRKKGKGK